VVEVASQTITWVLFTKAAHLVANAYGYSLKLAEADIVRWLGDHKRVMRWRGELRGQKRDTDPSEGSAEFWQVPKGEPYVLLQGPLSESRARRTTWAENPYRRRVVRLDERVYRPAQLSAYEFVCIEIAKEDVIAAMSPAAQARSAGMWPAKFKRRWRRPLAPPSW
jgi:hypothetical protein